jgi:hypothetical protein
MNIKNHADLAAHLGANEPTEDSISRRVYKDTSCGAWAHLEDAIPTGRDETWSWLFDIRQTIVGTVLVRVRRIQDRQWTAPKDAPQEVLECILGHEFRGGRCILTDEETIQFVKGNPPQHPHKYFRCKATTYSGGYSPGVSFGSIVEGVEQCTTVHTVAYPCTGEDIDRALQAVEDEARDIWDTTHGCPLCYPNGMPGEDRDPADDWLVGDTLVNPNCPKCHGQGVVI